MMQDLMHQVRSELKAIAKAVYALSERVANLERAGKPQPLYKVRRTTINTTLTNLDHILEVDDSNVEVQVTLPPLATSRGWTFRVVKTGDDNRRVIIVTSNAELFATGETQYLITGRFHGATFCAIGETDEAARWLVMPFGDLGYGWTAQLTPLLVPELRAYWTFSSWGEGFTGEVKDISGAGRHLTNFPGLSGPTGVGLIYQGAPLYSALQVMGIFVSSEENYLQRADIGFEALNGSGFSFGLLMSITGTAASDQGVVSKWDSSTSYCNYQLLRTTDDRLRFEVSDDGTPAGTWSVESDPINLDLVYHVVCVYRGSLNEMELYVNDVKYSEGASSSISVGNSPFEVGRTDGGNYFDGQIGRLWFSGFALSQQQVLGNFGLFSRMRLVPGI